MIALALLQATAAVAAPSEPSFCERLATAFGMAPSPTEPGLWRRDMATLGDHLFGGSQMTAVSVDMSDELRENVGPGCDIVKGGALCSVVGGMTLRLRGRDRDVTVVARDGEFGEVRIRNTKVLCADKAGLTDSKA